MTVSDDLRLSVPRMDQEHAAVLDAAAELSSLLKSAFPDSRRLTGLLDRFWDIVSRHFASEEELMRSHGYPGAAAHAAEHRRLSEQLNEVRTAFASGAIGAGSALSLFIEVWTLQHIQGPDRRFAEFVNRA